MKNDLALTTSIILIISVLLIIVWIRIEHYKTQENNDILHARVTCYPQQVIELYRKNVEGTHNMVIVCASVDGGANLLRVER